MMISCYKEPEMCLPVLGSALPGHSEAEWDRVLEFLRGLDGIDICLEKYRNPEKFARDEMEKQFCGGMNICLEGGRENRSELRQLQQTLIRFRKLGGDMTIQRLNALLEVYLSEEIDQSTLIKKAHLSRSAASKNIAAWTSLTAYKRKGPGYIRSTPDPMNLKTRILEITPAGRKAVEELFA